jgi:predicted alpha/beta hydrolase
MRIWGELDFAAVLQRACDVSLTLPVFVVGHSIGGFVPGIAPNNHRIDKLITVGAQVAYWPDYLPSQRFKMRALWHGMMPAVTRVVGYFPGSKLRLGEDLPKGVVEDWISTRDKARILDQDFAKQALPAAYAGFETLTAPTLAYSFTDDEFATEAAVARMFALMRGTKPEHRRMAPRDVAAGVTSVGHFGFFLDKFRDSLWAQSVEWLLR